MDESFKKELKTDSAISQVGKQMAYPRIPFDLRKMREMQQQQQPSAEQKSQPVKPLRYPIKIGITVFGTPTYFSLDDAISEFQVFVQNNSKLDLQITLNNYSPLALDEFHPIPGTDGCTFVDPWYVHPETLAKLPQSVAMQIVIYDIQNTKTAYGGAAFQASPQTRNVPFVGIAFGEAISWWQVEPNWRSRTATTLVHEFYHAFCQLVQVKGFTLPNPDKANDLGFTVENDPGWVRFDKFLYGQITDQMYEAVSH